MEHRKSVIKILEDYLKVPIIESEIISESYELFVSELDRRLLPKNYHELLQSDSVIVHYYAYEELIIYIITNIKNDDPIITGLLNNNKLQAYIIN